MNYKNDTLASGKTAEEQRMTRASRMKKARERLTEEFTGLLGISPEAGARWNSSIADLMEAAHIAYTQGTIRDCYGQTCLFGELVTQACRRLHIREPRNARVKAYTARNRKGVRRSPLIDRYCWQMFEEHVDRPLARIISLPGNKERHTIKTDSNH